MKHNDPYLYPDTEVLQNKQGIKIQEELDTLENDIVTFRMVAIRKKDS